MICPVSSLNKVESFLSFDTDSLRTYRSQRIQLSTGDRALRTRTPPEVESSRWLCSSDLLGPFLWEKCRSIDFPWKGAGCPLVHRLWMGLCARCVGNQGVWSSSTQRKCIQSSEKSGQALLQKVWVMNQEAPESLQNSHGEVLIPHASECDFYSEIRPLQR